MEHDFKHSVAPKCPPGHILRKSYTTKTGTYVPPRCIIERSLMPKSKITERQINEKKNVKENIEKLCHQEGCPTSCPKGQILRRGYKRSAYTKEDGTFVDSTLVAPECIKNRGKPGKGPKLIKISNVDHVLSDHGYVHVKDMTESQRHSALRKIIKDLSKDYGMQITLDNLIWQLRARGTLTKTTSPESSKAFIADQRWISSLLKEWKEKHGDDDKKDKKKMRLIILGPEQHLLSAHGYVNITGVAEDKRHAILRKVYRELAKVKGSQESFLTLIHYLNARANLGLTKSPESSKLMKKDADYISGLYSEWKEKHLKGGDGPIHINPDVHDLSDHGYKDVKTIPEDKRHKILLSVLKFMRTKFGDKVGFRKVIDQINAASILTKHTDPEDSKIFATDRDWVSGLYVEWKEKHGDKKKKGKIVESYEGKKLELPKSKKKNFQLKLKSGPKTHLTNKIEKMT